MSSKTVQDYLNLITSEHQNKPKFMATVALSVAVAVRLQQLSDSIESEGGVFDLDTPPVGNQEDIIGELVGVSRNITEPISGVYFTWAGSALLGWGSGVWRPPNQPTELVTLPDDVYLLLIRARIAANHWDGTTEGAYTIWAILFPTLTLLIQDQQDMTFIVALQGAPIDSLTQALLTQGYLPLKPEGVRITEYIVAVNSGPLFAWGVSNAHMDGWGVGSWGNVLPGA